jgi:hypothetical protein
MRLGRWIRISSTNLHPKPTTRGLVHIREHLWVLGQATGTFTHKTHHGPNSGEATTFPHIVYSVALHRGYIQMAPFSRDSQVGVPKLSRVGVLGLWTIIAPRPKLGSGQGLNQSCSSPWELFNVMLHCLRRHREEVDSWLLMVGSQTGSLTPGPSFAHNLGCRCPNGQCDPILDIYTSRSFHWYKERTKARWFDPSNRLLNFWESRRTPFSTFGSVSCLLTLSPKVGLRQKRCRMSSNPLVGWIWIEVHVIE